MHRTEQALRDETDMDFLRATFNKLLLNFTWWVNRKDRFARTCSRRLPPTRQHPASSDRSAPLPTGGTWKHATARRGMP